PRGDRGRGYIRRHNHRPTGRRERLRQGRRRSTPPPVGSIDDLDPVIHAPKRLAAMAILAASTEADFAFLRDHLGVSDSDLSKQMATLAAAGYVSVTKRGRGPGSTTTYRMTRAGRRAFDRHVAALDRLIAGRAGDAGRPAGPVSRSAGPA